MNLMWQCKCGCKNFLHYDYCASCGTHKPAPPPEEKPKPKKVLSVDTSCA